jgi:hypothetical protein
VYASEDGVGRAGPAAAAYDAGYGRAGPADQARLFGTTVSPHGGGGGADVGGRGGGGGGDVYGYGVGGGGVGVGSPNYPYPRGAAFADMLAAERGPDPFAPYRPGETLGAVHPAARHDEPSPFGREAGGLAY